MAKRRIFDKLGKFNCGNRAGVLKTFAAAPGRLLATRTVARNREWARERAHVESYGSAPVIVYPPDGERHGNFFDASYRAICAQPEWMRRFRKVHAQATRLLPRHVLDPQRRWRELDSSMSSDALLMNIFCAPEVTASPLAWNALGVEGNAQPEFGWKARVPLRNGRVDRTEIDMLWGSLMVEAKLTESDFQSREARIVEAYRDFEEVFDRELLPRAQIATSRPRRASEFPENVSQEFESELGAPQGIVIIDPVRQRAGVRELPTDSQCASGIPIPNQASV